MTNPKDQFQIGEEVVYVPEGVVTVIVGYLWEQKIGGKPQILSYELDCGINVRMCDLRRWIEPDPYNEALTHAAGIAKIAVETIAQRPNRTVFADDADRVAKSILSLKGDQ